MRTFEAMEMLPVVPTRVGGTHWVGYVVPAIEKFLKGYAALRSQLEDCVEQRGEGAAKKKARGYIRAMKRPDIITFLHLLLDVLYPLQKLSKTLQDRETTLADVQESYEVTKTLLEGIKDNVGTKEHQLFSSSDTLREFQGQDLSGSAVHENFIGTRQKICKSLLDALDRRFSDLSEGICLATEIASFKRWPLHEEKSAIHSFGADHVDVLTEHYKQCLVEAGVDTDAINLEWMDLKVHLYIRHKRDVQSLKWAAVMSRVYDEFPNVMALIDLVRALPASSAENERGFSQMKLTKTYSRTKLAQKTLNNVMTIQVGEDSVKSFDADPAIIQWNQEAKRPRRPNFMDGRQSRKKARLDVKVPAVSVTSPETGPDASQEVPVADDESQGADADNAAHVAAVMGAVASGYDEDEDYISDEFDEGLGDDVMSDDEDNDGITEDYAWKILSTLSDHQEFIIS